MCSSASDETSAIARSGAEVGNVSARGGTPLGLYVHIPYCHTKCGYCDFFTVPLHDRPTNRLVDAVIAELNTQVIDAGVAIRTVFVGGGTPTVLPEDDFARLFAVLGGIRARHGLDEFTVEANPATIDDGRLDVLLGAGVDRVSMGAQSFHPRDLKVLERLHDPRDVEVGVRLLRRRGVGRINLDLIFGVPGQSLRDWGESLRRTIELGVDHISCYGLTYEPGTRLTAMRDAGRIEPCDEQLEADMYLTAIDLLAEHGYRQYEISAFALPGHESLHNLIYWRNEPHVGVGPSAAGYADGRRYKNVAHINGYIASMAERGHARAETEAVDERTFAGETLMMRLRLNEGVDLAEFAQQTRVRLDDVCGDLADRFAAEGLMAVDERRWRLTRRGRLLADAIISEFYCSITPD